MRKLLYIAALAVAFIIGRYTAPSIQVEKYTTDTIIAVRVDTLRLTEPRYVTRTLLRVDTVELLSVERDTIKVQVPIQQAHYADSLYDLWISGYRPRLDSLHLYPRTVERTITQRIAPSRWSVGVQGGVGMTPKGVQPYIGVGVAYRLY